MEMQMPFKREEEWGGVFLLLLLLFWVKQEKKFNSRPQSIERATDILGDRSGRVEEKRKSKKPQRLCGCYRFATEIAKTRFSKARDKPVPWDTAFVCKKPKQTR